MSAKATWRVILMVCVLMLGTLLLAATRSAGAAPDASLTVTVNPAGKGNVNVSPPPPYSNGQTVTLTATPVAGWTFDRWELAGGGDPSWWDNGWDYRVAVTAGAAGFARKDKPAEIDLNFTALWASLGKTGTLDPNSIRVIEVDGSNAVIDANVPFQFDRATDFNASNKAAGTLVLLMKGNTPAGAQRHYHVYFDVTGKGFAPPSFPALVQLTEGVVDEGQTAFKIETPNGTYFLHTKGGGLSSLNDVNGNDWINYKSTVTGNGGRFRGIPNAVAPSNGGHFHPGGTDMATTLRNGGPLKATVHVKEKNAPGGRVKWEGLFEFYPNYVVFTMLAAPYNYWILYEGTPGGALQTNSDFIVRSDGTQTLTAVAWEGDLVNEEWVYLADPGLGRSIYFANEIDDEKTDSYDNQDAIMTKFGFGRKGAGSQLEPALLPRQFTFGLMDQTVYADAKPIIYNAYKALNVTAGAAEQRAGGLGSINPVNFTITGDHTIVAYFKPVQYTVNVTVTPADKGSVTKSPNKTTYNHGEQVTLQATPVDGWVFAGWSGDLTGTNNPATVTVTQNMNITATFSQSFTVMASANPPAGGTVTLNPPGPTYPPNTSVQVTATANSGYTFTGWSGDLSGSNPTETLVVNGNKTIVANFSAAQYTFSATSAGNGSVDWEPKKALYGAGEVVTVTATPDPNYSFVGWTGTVTSSLNPLAVTIAGNTALVANFAPQINYTLTLNAIGGGTIQADPDLPQYPAGTQVTLTAVPDAQKRFLEWGGLINGNLNPITITINSDVTVTATFVDDVYPLTTTVVGQGTITKQPDQPNGYFIGQVVTLTATATPGWQFNGWSGAAGGTDATTTVTIAGPTAVTATFSSIGPLTLTVSTAGNGSGTVNIDPEQDEYAYGDVVTLTPVPGPGSAFAGWSGSVNGSANPLQLTMTGNMAIVATFIIPAGPFSDNFNACNLPARWTAEQVGDAAVVATGRAVRIQVPEGSDHYINKSLNNAPRVMQQADNLNNLEIIAKFDSDVNQNFQTQGILIEQNASTLLRVDFTYNNGQMTVFAGIWSPGKLQQRLSVPIPAADANYLRVTRAADKWTISYSATGSDDSWQPVGNFKYTMNVSRAGVFAGNLKPAGGVAPALTAEIDYFQNVAEGPMAEDTPLLTVTTVGNGTVAATPPADQLECGQNVTLRATPSLGWQFGGWSGDATGTQTTVSMLINRPRAVTATFTGNDVRTIALPVIIR